MNTAPDASPRGWKVRLGRLPGSARSGVESALAILTPIAAVVAWAVISERADSFFFPPLLDILEEFADIWLFDGIVDHVFPSLARMGAGLAVAIVAGIGLGIPLGLSQLARHTVSPIFEFLRAIPAPALIPFLIVVIGIGNETKLIVIAIGCLWPILLGTIDGITGLDPTLVDTADVYGVRGPRRIRQVVLPAASPQIFAAIRQSVSLALILVVVAEMVASPNGIGFFVLNAERSFAIVDMWSGIIVLGILGYALNRLFLLVERRVMAWHRGAKASVLS